MRRFLLWIAMCFGLLLTTTLCASVSSKRIPPLRIQQAGVYEALEEAAEKAGVPIGFEGTSPRMDAPITVDFRGGTVADLMNDLMSRLHGYSWRETEEGVIRVVQNDTHIPLLDVAITYSETRATRQQIWADLVHRPEITAWLAAAGCHRQEYLMGEEFRDHNAPISISAGSYTLEQLLNLVTLKSGDHYWAVLRTSASKCEISIMPW